MNLSRLSLKNCNCEIKPSVKLQNGLDGVVADLEGLLGDGPVRQEADDAHARGEEEVDDLALVAVVRGEGNFSVKENITAP